MGADHFKVGWCFVELLRIESFRCKVMAESDERCEMRILYFSVHAILEFDEIRLFRYLGYDVFSLGTYFGGKASQAFRPEIDFGSDLNFFMSEFKRLGGYFSPDEDCTKSIIPKSFIELFDVVIVMHEPKFLTHFWDQLSCRPVIWRTIGVDIRGMDNRLSDLRRKGMHIVRYSPIEQKSDCYIGHDIIIRFSKRISDYEKWSGSGKFVLTFANDFAQRFAPEYQLYMSATKNLNAILGGVGNEDVPGSLGLVNYSKQLELLSNASCYFYSSGSFITYTLNFMEAWLAGTPMIVLDCQSVYSKEKCQFAEVQSLVTDGEDGFIINSAKGAHDIICELIGNIELSQKIGAAGAAKAKTFFDEHLNAELWKSFLTQIV